MRIAYFARIDLDRPSGVLKKIMRQLKYWESQGHEVKLFALSRPFDEFYVGLSDYSVSFWQTRNYLELLLKAVLAERAISDWSPDVVFWRYSSYYPMINQIILKRFPTIADVNSNYDFEYKHIHNRFAYWFHLVTKKLAFKNVVGFSALTDELASWLGGYNKPVLVIGDGIDLGELSPLPPSDNQKPRLVCFASKPYPWVALDKIVCLAQELPEIKFDIIGLNQSETASYNPPDNITFHGFLAEQEYLKILARADVAIGTLGLHRIDLQEMAPLKLREYLAHGLPAIIGYRDADFKFAVPFILELPNEENNVVDNIEEIKAFILKWTGKRVPQELIGVVDIAQKEELRLSFFEEAIT